MEITDVESIVLESAVGTLPIPGGYDEISGRFKNVPASSTR